MSAAPYDFEPNIARGPGPIVLILPLLVIALGLIWSRQLREQETGERPPAPQDQQATQVAGWAGEARPGAGVRLEVRLVPLHARADRQRFDRDALASRLGRAGRDEGEPWRVLLRYSADTTGGGLTGGETERTSALDLSDLKLLDSVGGVLRPVVSAAPAPADDASADPLEALLAAPLELAPGSDVTIVLWGPAPGEGARLVLGAIEVPLRAQQLASDAVPPSLARLDRGGAR